MCHASSTAKVHTDGMGRKGSERSGELSRDVLNPIQESYLLKLAPEVSIYLVDDCNFVQCRHVRIPYDLQGFGRVLMKPETSATERIHASNLKILKFVPGISF